MLTIKNAIVSLLLIFAIGLSSWSIYLSQKTTPSSTAKLNEPDAYMENVTATMINNEGKRTILIKSPKMVHFPENDTTDIQTPKITVYRDSPEPWYIQADFAKATNGIDKIFFQNKVILHHPHDIATPATTMKTDTLTVFPNQNIAKTEDAVIVLQPDTTVHAIGMMANLDEGVIKLMSAARGEYVPKQ